MACPRCLASCASGENSSQYQALIRIIQLFRMTQSRPSHKGKTVSFYDKKTHAMHGFLFVGWGTRIDSLADTRSPCGQQSFAPLSVGTRCACLGSNLEVLIRSGLTKQPTRCMSFCSLAGGPGFEPGLTESESVVLPLDDPPNDGPGPALRCGGTQDQRFEYCVARRALRKPTFFRSTSRASRVTKPALRRLGRKLSSYSMSARVKPCRIAPA